MPNQINSTRNLKFGVEIEIVASCTGGKECLKREMESRGVRAVIIEGVDHRDLGRVWKIENDGSCGWEVVSPVLTDFVELEKVCEALNAVGAKVNKNCGLHVHHDGSDLSLEQIKNVYRIYAKHEATIDSMLPESRRADNNRFCNTLNGGQMAKVERMNSIDEMKVEIGGQYEGHYTSKRYYKVNFCSYVRYGTIEFRQHSGTTEFEKMQNWVLFTNRIMEIAKSQRKAKSVKTEKQIAKEREAYYWGATHLFMELDMRNTDVSKYIGNRIVHFRKQSGQEVA